jgi:hypothetical protein
LREAILEEMEVEHQMASEDFESHEDDTTEREQLTRQDDRKSTAGLRFHFMQEINTAVLYL